MITRGSPSPSQRLMELGILEYRASSLRTAQCKKQLLQVGALRWEGCCWLGYCSTHSTAVLSYDIAAHTPQCSCCPLLHLIDYSSRSQITLLHIWRWRGCCRTNTRTSRVQTKESGEFCSHKGWGWEEWTYRLCCSLPRRPSKIPRRPSKIPRRPSKIPRRLARFLGDQQDY